MDKVKIAFIGTGHMGQKAHLENYLQLPNCEVVAIAEARSDLADDVAKKFNIPQCYYDYNELLDNVEADGYVCAQQYRNHLAILPSVLAKGKPILTEKPLSLSIEAGEKLVAAANKSGVVHMVGYHKRSDPSMEYAKDIIEKWKASGEYGRMKYIRATMPPGDWRNNADRPIPSKLPYPQIDSEPFVVKGLSEEHSNAYNAFVNYYIHQVNALRFLLGEPYIVNYADKSGVLMGCESVSGIPAILEMAPWSNSYQWNETYLVCFEFGYIFIKLPAPLACQQAGTITIMKDTKNEKVIEQPMMPNLCAMRNQAANFVKLAAGTGKAPCSSPEALEDLKIAMNYIHLKYGL